METLSLQPIGTIESCFKEKFGIPRQPGLVKSSRAVIKFQAPYSQEEAFKGLENYSHLWVQFVFHASVNQKWKATVRPPKMGGNKRIGVFATRSNFRPNPIGLSVVEIVEVRSRSGQVEIEVAGGDFLDGTPVLDIKPYLPYADRVEEASDGLGCRDVPEQKIVETDDAREQIDAALVKYPYIRDLIQEILENDPRPGFHRSSERIYGCHLCDYNLQWQAFEDKVLVISLEAIHGF